MCTMDKQKPTNFNHACTLLYKYCQLYNSMYKHRIGPPEVEKNKEADVGVSLKTLNVWLQQKNRPRASTELDFITKLLRHKSYQQYFHTLSANGYVYAIADIVTYLESHLYNQPEEFWEDKDDMNMREYNAFPSPRAQSDATTPASGRNTPVDIRKPIDSLLSKLEALY